MDPTQWKLIAEESCTSLLILLQWLRPKPERLSEGGDFSAYPNVFLSWSQTSQTLASVTMVLLAVTQHQLLLALFLKMWLIFPLLLQVYSRRRGHASCSTCGSLVTNLG